MNKLNKIFVAFETVLKKNRTSRDRLKLAPYPRLKNSKKTSKCQVFSFTVLENRNFFEKKFSKKLHTQKNGSSGAPELASASPWRAKVSQCRKTERGDPLRFFNIHSVAKHVKIEENKNFHYREKNITVPKKTERGGDPLGFFNIHSVAKHQKNAGGNPLGKKIFEKKVSQCRRKMKGGSLWSRPVWYVTRKNRKSLFGSVR